MYDMTVYIVRHGETDYNKEKRLQGEIDIPMNEYGRELARLTAAGLADVPFDKAFSSPLGRAKETAKTILGDRQVSLFEDSRIVEISLGEYEGLYFSEENYNIPDPDFMKFFDEPQNYRTPPKGESFFDVINRTGAFWEELIHDASNEGKTILVTSHGATIRGLLTYIQKLPIEQYWGSGLFKNCAAAIVEIKDGQVQLIAEGKVYY